MLVTHPAADLARPIRAAQPLNGTALTTGEAYMNGTVSVALLTFALIGSLAHLIVVILELWKHYH